MKFVPFFIALLLTTSLSFAHCGSCEKKTDGPACAKHKTEAVSKSDSTKAPCDSISCAKKHKDGAKCEKGKCSKHDEAVKCTGKTDCACPKCKKS